jgi:hypothetical protein
MKTPKSPAELYRRKIARKPAKSESCLQRAIIRWCRGMGAGIVGERFAAIPNGWGVSSATPKDRMIQGARLKAEGARAGMPDLIFWGCFGPTGSLRPAMLWVEVKLGTSGVISTAQRAVHDSLRENGHCIVIARDLAQAVKAILAFYGRGES